MNGSSGTARLWPWPGQVPGEHVEGVGEPGAHTATRACVAEVPSDGPSTRSGSSVAVRGAGQADGGDAGGHGVSSGRRRRIGVGQHRRRPGQRGLDERVGRAEVVAARRARRPGRPGCAARRGRRRAAASRVAAIRSACTRRPPSRSVACVAGDHGAAQQGPQGRPLGVPGAGRRARRSTRPPPGAGSRRAGAWSARRGAPARRGPGWPCAASSTTRRRRPRRARRSRAG